MVTTAARFSNEQPEGSGEFTVIVTVTPSGGNYQTVDVPANIVLPEGETMTWDWGDGTVETGLTGSPSPHRYQCPSGYNEIKIRIKGKIQAIGTNGEKFMRYTETTLVSPIHSLRVFKNGWDGFVQIGTTDPSVTGVNCGIPIDGIPDCVRILGNRALTGASGNITLPSGLVTLGRGIFENSYSLATCTIGEGVTAIPENAFKGCYELRRVTIPASVLEIGPEAFGDQTTALTNINVVEGNPVFSSAGGKCLIDNANHVLRRALSGSGVSSVPDGIVELGDYAFYYRTDMASRFDCPGRVTRIGKRSLSLTNITSFNAYEPGLVTIEADAFAACSQLKYVFLPETLDDVAGGDISNIAKCANSTGPLKSIVCLSPKCLQTVAAQATGIPSGLTLHVRPELVDTYRAIAPWSSIPSQVKAFEDGVIELDIQVPDDQKTVNLTPAWKGTSGMITVTVDWGDGNVQTIYGNPAARVHTYANAGQYRVVVRGPFDTMKQSAALDPTFWEPYIFYPDTYDSAVKRIITTGATITVLDGFKNSAALSGAIRIGYPVTKILDDCFLNCNGITDYDIGASVAEIESPFGTNDEQAARRFIFRRETPPTIRSYIAGFKSGDAIYVPDGSLAAYRSANRWSAYASQIHPLSDIEG